MSAMERNISVVEIGSSIASEGSQNAPPAAPEAAAAISCRRSRAGGLLVLRVAAQRHRHVRAQLPRIDGPGEEAVDLRLVDEARDELGVGIVGDEDRARLRTLRLEQAEKRDEAIASGGEIRDHAGELALHEDLRGVLR